MVGDIAQKLRRSKFRKLVAPWMEDLEHLHPRSLTQPLENDGWKTTLLLGPGNFSGAMLNFRRVFTSVYPPKIQKWCVAEVNAALAQRVRCWWLVSLAKHGWLCHHSSTPSESRTLFSRTRGQNMFGRVAWRTPICWTAILPTRFCMRGIASISYVPSSVAGREGVTRAITSQHAWSSANEVTSFLTSLHFFMIAWNKENIGCVSCAPVLLTWFFYPLKIYYNWMAWPGGLRLDNSLKVVWMQGSEAFRSEKRSDSLSTSLAGLGMDWLWNTHHILPETSVRTWK